jgi:hypothetical protein
MHRKLPEESGRIVLAVFRSISISAGERLTFGSVRNAFVKRGLRIPELSDGISFLIHHGCLRRGSPDDDDYYLTELGAALIVVDRDGGDQQFQEDPAEAMSVGAMTVESDTRAFRIIM